MVLLQIDLQQVTGMNSEATDHWKATFSCGAAYDYPADTLGNLLSTVNALTLVSNWSRPKDRTVSKGNAGREGWAGLVHVRQGSATMMLAWIRFPFRLVLVKLKLLELHPLCLKLMIRAAVSDLALECHTNPEFKRCEVKDSHRYGFRSDRLQK